MENLYDVAIIGGGPAGYTAAERAAAEGLKTILFEKADLGGVCLNEGCIPTKTMLYSAKIYDQAKGASKYGVYANDVSFDYGKIHARKNKTIKKLVAGIRAKLTNHEAEVVKGNVEITGIEAESTLVSLSCNDISYVAKNVLLCTGSETIIPPIPGINNADVWTHREALATKELPESIAIVGGGVIGMEFASLFNSLDVDVTVIEMAPEILGNMDHALSELLRADFTKRGIKFHLSTKVVEIEGGKLFLEHENGEKSELLASKILMSVGRRPTLSGCGLENLNLARFRNGLLVNEHMQTSIPNIYACGDVTGFSMLAHTAVREAEVAINTILGYDTAISYKAIPGIVYTNPEFAGVGKTEEQLKTEGVAYEAKNISMSFSGRFVAENEMVNGVCKILYNNEQEILGFHILGNPASELIVIAGMAIEKNMKMGDLREMVFPHPTVSEIIRESLY